jgi:hypothetical protein
MSGERKKVLSVQADTVVGKRGGGAEFGSSVLRYIPFFDDCQATTPDLLCIGPRLDVAFLVGWSSISLETI